MYHLRCSLIAIETQAAATHFELSIAVVWAGEPTNSFAKQTRLPR